MQIVIGTSPDRSGWLQDCLRSIDRDVLVISDYSFELGKIRWVVENTRIERFLFLQDSFLVNDSSFFDLLEQVDGSVAITDVPSPYGSYAGVYERKILRKIAVPACETKEKAVYFEMVWTRAYVAAAKRITVLFPGFGASGTIGERHGRKNMVFSNQYLTKFKGTWSTSQLDNPIPIVWSQIERKKFDKAMKNSRNLFECSEPNEFDAR